jgi:hypothetical protein
VKLTEMIKQGEITENDCDAYWHWDIVVPVQYSDIPLIGYNKKQCYIYHFLIACYREKKHNEGLKRTALKSRIKKIAKYYEEYISLITQLDSLEHSSNANTIFDGARIDQYSGV